VSKSSKPLTPEQQKMVRDHEGLVFKIALSLSKRSYSLEDLLSEGRLGLCIAASKFDPERGFKFSTYAAHWVRSLILEFIMKNQSQVHFGARHDDRKVYFQLGRARQAVGTDLDAIAAYIGIDRKNLEEALPRVERTDVDLDLRSGIDIADVRPLAEDLVLADEAARRLKKRIWKALQRLKPRERIVAEHRLLKQPRKPLRVLGDEFGISRERVRQIELQTRAKLRDLLADLAA
jgi:RNA polymerase sigma-32 factor